MSIEVDIFSTTPTYPSWGQVKEDWKVFLSEQPDLTQKLLLRKLGTDALVKDDENLLPENVYYLDLGVPNTLGIIVSNGHDLDTREYLEDYGRNLSPEQITDYVNCWNSAGYYIEVTSQAGRSKREPMLFVTLAKALANSCNGYIIVMHSSIFSLGVGVYSPDEFGEVKTNF